MLGTGERKKGHLQKWLESIRERKGESQSQTTSSSFLHGLHFSDIKCDSEIAARYGHNMIVVTNEGLAGDLPSSGLLIFGGCDSEGEYLDDLWAFLPSSSSFIHLPTTEKRNNKEGDEGKKHKKKKKKKGKKRKEKGKGKEKEKGKEEQPSTKRRIGGGGNEALRRTFGGMVQHNNKEVYLFGGKSRFFLNDLWRLDLECMEWERLEYCGSKDKGKPSRRMGHSAVLYNDAMWIFGGFDSAGFACNDLWQYELATKTWKKIEYQGEIDCRYHHGAAVSGDIMYVYGGKGDSGVADPRLFQYSFVHNTWTVAGATAGEARWSHAFAFSPALNALMLHGGQSSTGKLRDCWAFSIDSKEWEKIEYGTKYLSKGITYHSLVFRNEDGFIFGGMTEDSNRMTEVMNYANRISLQSVPVELGLLIFSPLSPADLSRAMCVCRHWRDIASDESLWKPHYLVMPNVDRTLTSGFKDKVIEAETKEWDLARKMKLFKGRQLRPTLRQQYAGPTTILLPVKLVVVGDGAVGKTCLLITYTSNAFPSDWWPTMFDNYTANVMVDNKPLNVGLWDTAGQDDYDRLRPLTYPQTDVFMLCFSVVNRNSFNNIKAKWVHEVMGRTQYTQSIGLPVDMPYILVGLKTDLYEDAEIIKNKPECRVSDEEAKVLAAEIGALGYYPVSSLTFAGLKEAFDGALRAAIYENDWTPGVKKKGDRCCLQ